MAFKQFKFLFLLDLDGKWVVFRSSQRKTICVLYLAICVPFANSGGEIFLWKIEYVIYFGGSEHRRAPQTAPLDHC